jgi:hypothetical protein
MDIEIDEILYRAGGISWLQKRWSEKLAAEYNKNDI